jgi:uncharacterized protein involved in outer membrane biogenesis
MDTERIIAPTPPRRSLAKKIVLGLLVLVVALVIVVALGVHFFLDGAVKRGVERVGPKMTQTEVKLGSIHIGLFSGNGSLNKLIIGNPPGYKSPNAIMLGNATLAVKPSTIFSSKVVIPAIHAEAPEVFFEQDLHGNNLNKIRANLQKASSDGKSGKDSPQAEPDSSSKHRLQVDDFLITGGKVHVNIDGLGVSKSMTVALPEIHLQNLGTNPEGITPAELAKKVIEVILEKATEQAAAVAGGLGKNLQIPDLGTGSNTNAIDSVTRGVGGLLKSKKN